MKLTKCQSRIRLIEARFISQSPIPIEAKASSDSRINMIQLAYNESLSYLLHRIRLTVAQFLS